MKNAFESQWPYIELVALLKLPACGIFMGGAQPYEHSTIIAMHVIENQRNKSKLTTLSTVHIVPHWPNIISDFDTEHTKALPAEFNEHKLAMETQCTFDVRYHMAGFFTGYTVFPIHDSEGNLVSYCGSWLGEPFIATARYKFAVNFRKSQVVFNLHRAVQESSDSPLIIAEEFFDVMKLWQRGAKRTVSLMGKSISIAQENLIRRHAGSRSRILLLINGKLDEFTRRAGIAARLSMFASVKIHVFDQEGQQSEHLSAEEISSLFD